MSKVVETKKVKGHPQYLIFWCLGCKCLHAIYHKREDWKGPVWNWNGSFDKPTFTPSLLVNVGGACPTAPICHSYITDGKIQYLPDCTHALAGKTVEIPDSPLEQNNKEAEATKNE